MKTTLNASLKVCLFTAALMAATTNYAQGTWANVWVRLIASPEGTGQVWGTLSGNNEKSFSQTYDVKGTVELLLGVEVLAYLYDQPLNGYHLAGWYWDVDENGKLDLGKDVLLDFTNNGERTLADWGSDWAGTLFDSKEEALAGPQPSKPQLTFIALFTKGASAELATFTRNMGEVHIDHSINNPGDEVTITALPNEGYAFENWTTRSGTIVSTDNPYTFTVAGGETYYANFYDPNAPEVEFPAEGGYKAIGLDRTWWLRDTNNAYVICLSTDDLNMSGGQSFFKENSESRFQMSLRVSSLANRMPDKALATIMWGKGKVKFVKSDLALDHNRVNNPVFWSTVNGQPVTRVDNEGIGYYAYVFNEQIGAFIQYDNTDFVVNPHASTRVTLPLDVAYLWMPATSLSDQEGNIPVAIGLDAESFERGKSYFSNIQDARVSTLKLGDHTYWTLSGRRLSDQPVQPGIYIRDGKKVIQH